METIAQQLFGTRLHNARLSRGIDLDVIAAATNVPVVLWEGLERGDLTGWPHGVLARGWIVDYARLVGLDHDETLSEFCTLFAQGDRRRERIVTGFGSTIATPAVWTDDWQLPERRQPLQRQQRERRTSLRRRGAAIALDIGIVAALAVTVNAVLNGVAPDDSASWGALFAVAGLTLIVSPGRWLLRRSDRS